jgi:hypothetical protein
MNSNWEELVPPKYDLFKFKADSVIIFGAQGLLGVMDSRYQVLCEARFTQLDFIIYSKFRMEGSSAFISNHVFYATEKNNEGIYDSKYDAFITNKEPVEPIWRDDYDSNSEANYVCNLTDSSTIVYNAQGDSVSTIGYSEEIIFFYPHDMYGTMNTHDSNHCYLMVYTKPIGCDFIYKLNTNKKSKTYDRIESHYDKFIFEDSTGWGILDSNLSEIYRTDKYFHFQSRYYLSRGNYTQVFYQLPYSDNWSWIPKADEPFVLCYKKGDALDSKSEDWKEFYCSVGVVNYETSKFIPPEYDNLFRIRTKNGSYIYAFKFSKIEQGFKSKPVLMDVYDENFKRIKRMPITEIVQLPDNWSYNVENPILFIRNKNGKIGGVNELGKTVFPFKFESFRATKQNYYPFFWSADNCYFELGIGDKKGLYDLKGNEILPVVFD